MRNVWILRDGLATSVDRGFGILRESIEIDAGVLAVASRGCVANLSQATPGGASEFCVSGRPVSNPVASSTWAPAG